MSFFVGMRGKRPEDYIQQYDNYSNNDDDLRLYQTLMTGSDSLTRWYENQLNGLDSFNEKFGYVKRAPAGFVGMRGKRFYVSNLNELFSNFELNKRIPSGFTAMRGKRAPVGFEGIFFLILKNLLYMLKFNRNGKENR